MELETLFGLPAHPLVVHAAVVLIPLTALGAIFMLSREWRRRIGWLVVGLAAVAMISVQLAVGTGEALEESVHETPALEEHEELAEAMLPLSILLLIGTGGLMVYDARRSDDDDDGGLWRFDRRPVALALSGLALAAGAVSTFQVVRVGHTGAESAWSEVVVMNDHADLTDYEVEHDDDHDD